LLVAEKLGNRRVTGTEQYYTPRDLAKSLVHSAFDKLPPIADTTFLEPAAGNGSFVAALRELGAKEVIAIDRYPAAPGIRAENFLESQLPQTNLVTITNPPFGRNNALSIPFFNHAAKFSHTICFLVPRSWRKWSVTNRLDLSFHLVRDTDVFVSYEDPAGQPIRDKNGLRTCFQIWQRKQTPREKVIVPDNQLVQKCAPDQADVALRVFGYGCGKVLKDFERVPNTTLMFLKINDRGAADFLPDLEFSRFSENTAYTQALAFTEINYLLNEAVFNDPFHIERTED
jgi:predicted RNA methylase